MKISFVVPRMGGGGAERVISLLANEFVKENEVSLITLVEGESFYCLNDKITLKSIGVSVNRRNKITTFFSKLFFFPKAFFVLRKILKAEKSDVVVSMLKETDLLVYLCRKSGLKFKHVCSERNDPTTRKKFTQRMLNKVYKSSDLFVCQGQKVFEYYSGVSKSKKKIIANPINGENIPDRLIGEKRRIVSVGRLDKQKNFPLIIKSFARLPNKFEEYALDIYGEGPERTYLQKLIDDENMSSKITLCGAKQNLLSLISDADLFVLPSNYEGFPNALLEAMAIGLPVISTDFSTGIANELILHDNGRVVPVGDVEKMTEALCELLSDSELRKKMGRNNREKCKEFYTPKIIQKWKDAINGLFENKEKSFE